MEKEKHTKERKHGTCIATIVSRNAIYTIGDGRCISSLEYNLRQVVDGNKCKLHIISRRLLATTAGDADKGDSLIRHVKAKAKKSYNLFVIKKNINEYLKEKKRKDEKFGANVNVFRYVHGYPIMYSSDTRSCQRLPVGTVKGSGSGCIYAGVYISMCQTDRDTATKEYYEILQKGGALAACVDPYSGGHLKAAKISNKKKRDVQIESKSHVLKIIGSHYDVLECLLGQLYFIISKNLDYNLSIEDWVKDKMTERFQQRFSMTILTVDWIPNVTIVRVLSFGEPYNGELLDSEEPYDDGVGSLAFFKPTTTNIDDLANMLVDYDF